MDQDILLRLEGRWEASQVKRRLEIEAHHENRLRRKGTGFFHIESWYSVHSIIRNALRLAGLYGQARRNADKVLIRRNPLVFRNLPSSFDGFTILHISDLHVDMNEGALESLLSLVDGLRYDLCVLTGDYRGKTFGPFAATLDGMQRLRSGLSGPVWGVLGNHDTLHMVPHLEEMGIRVLLNECEEFVRGGQRIYLSGIDDAHHYKTHDIERAAARIPGNAFSILLSHTPAVYDEASKAEFDLMLSGHTHGGQICLPGSVPVILERALPRRFASGGWEYRNLTGYTSVGAGASLVPVRLNCPAEIVLHQLLCG